MFTKSALTIALAVAMSAVSAQDMPNNGLRDDNGGSFTGTGQDAIVNNPSPNPGYETDKEGNPLYYAFATINNMTISGYRDLVINNEANPDDNWNYAIYSAYSTIDGTNISVDVSRDISIRNCQIAVHTMGGSKISLKAGNNFLINSNGNGIFAQRESHIEIVAGNDITVAGASNVVGTMNSTTQDSTSISLVAGKKISVTANNADGYAIRTQTNGGILTFVAPEGLEVNGNINTITGTVNLAKDDKSTTTVNVHGQSSAQFGNLNGSDVTFNFDRLAKTGKTLSIASDNTTGTVTANVGYEDLDNMSVGQAQKALLNGFDADNINGFGSLYTIAVDAQKNVTVDGSDITKYTNDLAALNLVSWRNETTTLTDRMSTLRTNPKTVGAWARYNGGEYQYDARGVKNQFNTVEVGVDTQVQPQWIVGASFSYTAGSGDMDNGETDTDTYAGALYALWTHEKGSFVDFVMKAGRMSSDFDFSNRQGGAFDDGTFDQTGFIVGIETGHRFTLPMNTFVEPQLQLTYSRLSSVSETTAKRHVDLEASDSLLGRVGLLAGLTCPNDRGSAYVRASFVRDFRGDIDGTYAARSGGATFSLSQELDDSWFEYGIGGNFKVSDQFLTFVDVSRSAGADIDLDWRVNAGAKLFF